MRQRVHRIIVGVFLVALFFVLSGCFSLIINAPKDFDKNLSKGIVSFIELSIITDAIDVLPLMYYCKYHDWPTSVVSLKDAGIKKTNFTLDLWQASIVKLKKDNHKLYIFIKIKYLGKNDKAKNGTSRVDKVKNGISYTDKTKNKLSNIEMVFLNYPKQKSHKMYVKYYLKSDNQKPTKVILSYICCLNHQKKEECKDNAEKAGDIFKHPEIKVYDRTQVYDMRK